MLKLSHLLQLNHKTLTNEGQCFLMKFIASIVMERVATSSIVVPVSMVVSAVVCCEFEQHVKNNKHANNKTIFSYLSFSS